MIVIEEEEKQAHREAVAARIPVMDEHALRNMARIAPGGASCNAVMMRRFERIIASPKNRANKIAALWQWADEAMREITPATACRSGCSHCCHVEVIVPKAEAELIAARTGRKIASPDVQRGGEPSKRYGPPVPWGYDHPCTFLRNGRCSIYAHRPLACRTQFNFDDDALLCMHTCSPEENNPVPYWGGSRFSAVALVEICGLDAQAADIREWFPK
jgi:uncharacterized protein